MEFIPEEVVAHILGFMNISDRKMAALVSWKWYRASRYPALMRDTLVVLDVGSQQKLPNALPGLQHRIVQLSLAGGIPDLSPAQLTQFLAGCRSLRSLDLTGCNSLFLLGNGLQIPDNAVAIGRLQRRLSNVRHLGMGSLRHLTDNSFWKFVDMFPNVESLDLSANVIIFNSNQDGINGSKRLNTACLTFQCLLLYFEEHASHLSSLNLSRTQVNNAALEQLGSVPGLKLQFINLEQCREISDAGIKALVEKQKSIQELSLAGCTEITSVSVQVACKNLPELSNLSVARCPRVDGQSVSSLKDALHLQTINFSGCHGITSMQPLCHLTYHLASCGLQEIHLTHSVTVSDEVMYAFCQCEQLANQLRVLEVSSCQLLTDTALMSICGNFTELEHLAFAWNKKITDFGLLGLIAPADSCDHKSLQDTCKCCRKVALTEDGTVEGATVFPEYHRPVDIGPAYRLPTTEELSALEKEKLAYSGDTYGISNLRKLRFLDLSQCTNLSDAGLSKCLKLPELRELKLNGIRRLSDVTLRSIASNTRSVERMELSSSCVSDAGVELMLRRLMRLRSLVLSDCDQLTDKSLENICKHCPLLRQLDLSRCGLISDEAADRLESALSQLRSLNRQLIGYGPTAAASANGNVKQSPKKNKNHPVYQEITIV